MSGVYMMKQSALSKLRERLGYFWYRANHLRLFRQIRSTHLLAYTMGKVGTTAICASLRELIRYRRVFHVHNLTLEAIEAKEESDRYKLTLQARTERKVRALLLESGQFRAKLITMVRDPIARDISCLFQDIDYHFGGKDIGGITVSDLQNVFEQVGHNYTLNWFDDEFKVFLGQDIFAYPFDTAKGYQIYSWPSADVLLMRIEDINRVYQQAMWEFLGINVSQLKARNTTNQKESRDLYEDFKKHFRLDAKTEKDVYDSKMARHFYSSKEIGQFIARWRGKPL